MKIVKAIRYSFGVLYVMAGIAKAFPQIEDVGETLSKAAISNKGTWVGEASDLLASHSYLVSWIAGIALLSSGLCYLFNRMILPAVIGQCLMLTAFVTILHRAFPEIIFVDLIFLVVALLVLWESSTQKELKYATRN